MPSLKVRESTGGSVAAYLREDEEMATFARRITNEGIAEATRKQYELNVEKVGGCDPISFLRFLRGEYAKPVRPPEAGRKTDRRYRYASQTVRGYKSACVHMAALRGSRWHADDSRQIECFMNGYEASGLPPNKRSAISPNQFKQYIDYCRSIKREDLADSALIQWSAGVRPRDIDALCLARTFTKPGDVWGIWGEVKAPLHLKVRQGFDFPHALTCDEGVAAIKRWALAFKEAGIPADKPFFKIDHGEVSAILQMLQTRHHWPGELNLDGPHVFRHSMATETFDRAIKAAQARGSWKTLAAVQGYAIHANGRSDAGAARRSQFRLKYTRARRA